MRFTLTHSEMPESPRRSRDVDEVAATGDEAHSAASALHAETQVVKFDDFQSHFFPTTSGTRPPERPADAGDGPRH